MAYTDIEQRILDMWPKFEDGAYVMYEDEFDFNGEVKTAHGFNFGVGGRVAICSDKGSHVRLPNGEHVKRPAPKVLDADGVEIRVGDTVYEPRMFGDNSFTVSRFTKNRDGKTFVMVEEMGGGLFPETVTHIRPDSRERVVGLLDKGVVARIDKLVEEGRWLND